MIIPNIWKNKKCSKPPARYLIYVNMTKIVANMDDSYSILMHIVANWPVIKFMVMIAGYHNPWARLMPRGYCWGSITSGVITGFHTEGF